MKRRIGLVLVLVALICSSGLGAQTAWPKRAKRDSSRRPKGRVALISAASTFPPHSRAGNTRGDMPARPGLSPLRFTTTYTVTPERLADLRRVAAELSGNPPGTGDTLNFGGRRYVAGRATTRIAAAFPRIARIGIQSRW